jgi:trans-aconitate methyltransferase
MKDNERRKTAFSNAMTYMQSRQGFGFSASQLLSSYDWASAATVVDIGGGHGTTCVHIAESNPSIRCIVQDLPDIVAEGERLIPSEVADKITFMAHDFFTEQPVKDADVYFLRWILHDWSDPKAITILRNLIPALKSGTNIVLQEFILPDPGVVSFYQEKIIRCVYFNTISEPRNAN